MKRSNWTIFCVFIIMAICAGPCMAQYQPKDMLSWDYWLAVDEDAGTYHAYYLQYPTSGDPKHRHGNLWGVGHAVSRDLRSWKAVEDALKPIPETFNDRYIATGSIARGDDDKWYMWFTSGGTETTGIALALSDDLTNWKKIPESVIPLQSFQAEWDGKLYDGKILADPYIHPEKIDGFYWLTINTRILSPPPGTNHGAVLMMKSKDLRSWEPHKFVAYPGPFDRCETTQTWEHNGKWYLFFGGAGGPRGNHIYMADAFDGPYTKQPWSRMKLPGGQDFYIGKHIRALDGKEYFLAGVRYSALSVPYLISYGEDGRVLVSDAAPKR